MSLDTGSGSFRLWTNCSDRASRAPLSLAESRRFFVDPGTNCSSQVTQHLVSRRAIASAAEETFLVVVEIENYTRIISSTLESALSGFPSDLLESVEYNHSTGQNVAVLPRNQRSHSVVSGLSFFINYPILPIIVKEKNEPPSIQFIPIATWICSGAEALLPHLPVHTQGISDTIFLICASPSVAMRLGDHYNGPEHRDRRRRLKDAPLWISMDLQFVFSDWSRAWNKVREDLSECHSQIHGDAGGPPLLDLTRKLHKDASRVIALREQLRVHSGAVARLVSLVNKQCAQAPSVQISALKNRVIECQDVLTYQEETSQVILRQLENLLSLSFNMETMLQGQTMARLNVLAFAFLPMSFVASLFGMTKFNISAAWYPLWTFIILVIVVATTLFIPAHKVYRLLTSNNSQAQKNSPKKPQNRNKLFTRNHEYMPGVSAEAYTRREGGGIWPFRNHQLTPGVKKNAYTHREGGEIGPKPTSYNAYGRVEGGGIYPTPAPLPLDAPFDSTEAHMRHGTVYSQPAQRYANHYDESRSHFGVVPQGAAVLPPPPPLLPPSRSPPQPQMLSPIPEVDAQISAPERQALLLHEERMVPESYPRFWNQSPEAQQRPPRQSTAVQLPLPPLNERPPKSVRVFNDENAFELAAMPSAGANEKEAGDGRSLLHSRSATPASMLRTATG
ncbi:hypothetical protein BU16DRAFT_561877 [Lophium mytilinum]|uniref:Cora-domain-containing protein n=1 Tax=Lophium mytilinum TaxID=390894 RepID=A0A6A6QTT5_9PEZI|nr:hypothetical protein BU16DRAFT_561877 [Lophium mytilinum]